MVFSSITFLFLFLPVVLVLYHLLFLPVTLGWHSSFWRRASNCFLLLASLLFYFWGEDYLIWIIVTSTLIDYFCGLLISGGLGGGEIHRLDPNRRRTAIQKFGLIFSICSNLAFLGFFKYFNFGIYNYNRAMGAFGLESLQWLDAAWIALPLGISFYTFQSMSYTIDVYRGEVKATRNLIDFACYVTMFPQLVAGPIVRYRDVARELVSRKISSEHFASGVSRFILGLAKKVLIANTVAVGADQVFALPDNELTFALAWFGVICYTLQIYFDFSGYSDMAIGLGRMFGFNYLENFNYPYIAQSIQDFWRRWHISLSTWFRDYLYIPLGGSRGSGARTYFNLVTVFFLCGFWHGASFTFIAWGLYHGFFLVIERVGLLRFLSRMPRGVRHAYAVLVVMGGWVLFRCAGKFAQAIAFYQAMVGLGQGTGEQYGLDMVLTADISLAILIGIFFSAPVLPYLHQWVRDRIHGSGSVGRILGEAGFSSLRVIGLATLFGLSAMWLSAGTHNPFIYFRF
ncbi:MAG: MBOAT family protein [Candidatus Omnitrophica bacterium]|nr:MBOAT family protein [Candidatus Omnitrophota bacterium]